MQRMHKSAELFGFVALNSGPRAGVGNLFWNFCFEMVNYYGAYLITLLIHFDYIHDQIFSS